LRIGKVMVGQVIRKCTCKIIDFGCGISYAVMIKIKKVRSWGLGSEHCRGHGGGKQRSDKVIFELTLCWKCWKLVVIAIRKEECVEAEK
jgi:hypothetical protein